MAEAAPVTAGKMAEVMFENYVEVFEHSDTMLDLVTVETPSPATMQNTNDVSWKSVEQLAPIIEGWDLVGKEQSILEQTYPRTLGTPKNDFVEVPIRDLRDIGFWERRGKASAKRQISHLNSEIAKAIGYQGSLFFIDNSSESGYEIVAKAQTVMNERQFDATSPRYFLFNDRDNLKFSAELASRQTLQGRPEKIWKTGQIAQNVAGFDVFVGSFAPSESGGASAAATVLGTQRFKPEAGTVNETTKVVTNKDYREATIYLDYTGGDLDEKIVPGNKMFFVKSDYSDGIKPLALVDKNVLDHNYADLLSYTNFFFSVISVDKVAKSVTVFPKPIAANDTLLTAEELPYINVDKLIETGWSVGHEHGTRRMNLFWDKSCVEVLSGEIPVEMFKTHSGQKSLKYKMKNGVSMCIIYDSNIVNMSFRYRMFVWYGINIAKPHACGSCIITST